MTTISRNTQGLNKLLQSFDWATVGCFIDDDRYVYCTLLNQWIARIRLNGLEDRRFTSSGQFSIKNDPSNSVIQSVLDKTPSRLKPLAGFTSNKYSPWWPERDRLVKEFLINGFSAAGMEMLLDQLLLLKDKADAVLNQPLKIKVRSSRPCKRRTSSGIDTLSSSEIDELLSRVSRGRNQSPQPRPIPKRPKCPQRPSVAEFLLRPVQL